MHTGEPDRMPDVVVFLLIVIVLNLGNWALCSGMWRPWKGRR